MKRAAALGLSLLATLAPLAGCSGTAECDAVASALTVNAAAVPIRQLEVSGGACDRPFCIESDDTGGCRMYSVWLPGAGTCNLVATAIDGRKAVATVNVHLQSTGPCGPLFVADHDVTFTFPALPDGGSDGGAP
jgi:hypothetical protein